MFEPVVREREDLLQPLLRAAGARGREADVVTVHVGDAAGETLVARVADHADARVRAVRDLGEGPLDARREVAREPRLAVFDRQRLESPLGGLVHAREHRVVVAGIGTALWLVRQLEQHVVVPELDLDPAIERASPRGRVRCDGAARAEAVALEGRGGKAESVLQLQRDAPRARLRQRHVRAVDPRGAALERAIVGMCHDLDREPRSVLEIRERASDLPDEARGQIAELVAVLERRHEVADARTSLLALPIAELADPLRAADLHPLHVALDDHLFRALRRARLVVPDFDLDPAVQRTALRCRVRRHGHRVAHPRVGDRLRRQHQRALQSFGDLARSLSRETLVVAEAFAQRRGRAPGRRRDRRDGAGRSRGAACR